MLLYYILAGFVGVARSKCKRYTCKYVSSQEIWFLNQASCQAFAIKLADFETRSLRSFKKTNAKRKYIAREFHLASCSDDNFYHLISGLTFYKIKL